MLRQLELEDMDAAARVHRAAFDHALPWLKGLYTPDQDRWFYRERVFRTCRVWGAFEAGALCGIMALREDWIDQLYVLPPLHRRGTGSELLRLAQRMWTFQRNLPARRFYEARGFVLAEETDGARNEEKEPDARYLWTPG